MANDLKSLNLKQLEKLAADVAKEIEARATKQKDAALKAVEKAAKEHGFVLTDLIGEATAKTRGRKKAAPKAKLPAKYKNPENASQTWSGRGRQPEWYKAAIAAGKSPKSLEV